MENQQKDKNNGDKRGGRGKEGGKPMRKSGVSGKISRW